ncbi:MAG: FAD:protein transferase [Thermoleophilaceae bacterium]|jgi:thiamine biosynthesis lipoprotein|nr:FAD:protein transferase [Thermoleophilaceae bacterium]
MSEHDVTFESMGCAIRLIVGEPLDPRLPDAAAAVAEAQRWLHRFDARLSRFRLDSELCALNADAREEVPASALLRAAVAAGVWAAERSGGLVDPTLMREIEEAGYARSLAPHAQLASLEDALAWAPLPRPAAPSTAATWRAVHVDEDAGVIRRPAGVRIDSGGTGKGLAADALAHRLAGYSRVVVDCGGDIRVTGAAEIQIEHPLSGEPIVAFDLRDGAVATSGIDRRIWRTDGGEYAHHLIDPSTGTPAWTGVIQASALAPTALEAETLSKTALLSGPRAGRRILEASGGAIVHDDGSVETVGALAAIATPVAA